MFQIGDIVTLSDIGHNIYRTELYKQRYIVTYAHERRGVKVKGFTNGLEICYSNHIVELDKIYSRKQKIKKICSKLEIE
jgi:hypothetical protein